MPFNLYLTSSINYELTHQLILKTLLESREFTQLLTGENLENYHIVLEPEGGRFDIGIKSNTEEKWLYLLELKMWSTLSKQQLKGQTEFLTKENVKGIHILLGTADLIHYQSEAFDKIIKDSKSTSRKIGYDKLISALENFSLAAPSSPLSQMAESYAASLKGQYHHILSAWKQLDKENDISFYSLYYHMSKSLPQEQFLIYPVNNAAGGSVILNDQYSWIGFNYKGQEFEAYHEILDGIYMIRMYSEDANSQLRNELKQLFIEYFSKLDTSGIKWGNYSKASKWHKILTYSPQISDEASIAGFAEVMVKNRPILKQVIAQINNIQPN
jgi:hypothetical protein